MSSSANSATISVLPCRGGQEFLDQVFGPLGYATRAVRHPLDAKFPEWGESPYYTVELAKTTRHPGGYYDHRPCATEGIIRRPNAGFYLSRARDIVVRHCEVAWGLNPPDYYRYALEAEDVPGLPGVVGDDRAGDGRRVGVCRLVFEDGHVAFPVS